MFPGRQSGSRSLQGIAIKSQYQKICEVAEHANQTHIRSGMEYGRARTQENVACAIFVTLACSVLVAFATHSGGRASAPMKWAGVLLAAGAAFSTLVKLTRLDPQRETAHFQTASRYRDLITSCRAAVAKYEEKLIGDEELQALLDRDVSDLNALEKHAERI